MKIIEALKEFPLIDKKISKSTQELQKYSSNLDKGEDTDLPFKTKEEQQKQVDSLLQSIIDLTKRKVELKRKLYITNATVVVTIDGMSATITEWIDYRQGTLQKIIDAYVALNDTTASQMISSVNVDLLKGVKTMRFYDEAKRNDMIIKYSDIKDKIDAHLEMVNATTDIIEG